MEKGKLNLPKPYISPSQISTWKYNKGQYVDRYIFGIETKSTPQLRYGKQFADWLEKGWGDADAESKKILEKLKKYPIFEHRLEETFFCDQGAYDFLGFIDSFNLKNFNIYEYKTGGKVWDQSRVDQHLQTLLYAGVVYKNTGILPRVDLAWIPTKQVDLECVPTGDIFYFKADITVARVLRALKEMESTALEINQWYTDYQKTASEILTA